MKKYLALFALLLCLAALPLGLFTGCGAPLFTPDISRHLTLDEAVYTSVEVDFGNFLEKKMDARYQDCHDLPHYMEEYKAELFWSTVLPKASLNYNSVSAALEAKKQEWIRPAEVAFAQYLAAYGSYATYTDLDSYAMAYYQAGTNYASLDEYAAAKARAALLRLAVLYRVAGEAGDLPTEAEISAAYEKRIDDLLADTNKKLAAEGAKLYTRDEIIATTERTYGTTYMRDDVIYGLLLERVLAFMDETWTLTVPELSEEDTPTFDKTEIDPEDYEDTEEVTTLVRLHVSSLGGRRVYPSVSPRGARNGGKLPRACGRGLLRRLDLPPRCGKLLRAGRRL